MFTILSTNAKNWKWSSAGGAIHFVVDLRECFLTVQLIPHLVIETMIKHFPKLLLTQIGIGIQHLEAVEDCTKKEKKNKKWVKLWLKSNQSDPCSIVLINAWKSKTAIFFFFFFFKIEHFSSVTKMLFTKLSKNQICTIYLSDFQEITVIAAL